jgi:hypothetical protein
LISFPDTSAWEYFFHLCETLCKGCHAAEHGKIRPEHGWDFVGEDDLGGLYETCERCGTDIRYAYFIQHNHWEPMVVGTVCCDDVTGTETASNLRKKRDRLKRFVSSSRWIRNGSEYSITQKRFRIEIVKEQQGYRLLINNKRGHVYSAIIEAMEKAFEFIDSGEAQKYFSESNN